MAEEESGGNKTFSYVEKYPGYPRTALKWPVTPQVMSWGPRLIYERYHIPIVISENGLSCNDRIYLDGKVHDPDRIDFLARYLSCLSEAVESGVPVKGYFHWSFTDNMEWHSGYEDRFGLIYVDYRDQRRIPKDSAFWYSNLIREQ
jgi:beta-glucosidase